MSKNGRDIAEFPFNRKNADQLKELGQKAVFAQANLIAFMKQIGSDQTPERRHLSFEFSVVEMEMSLTELLENTFSELTPVEWGFSK